MCNFVRGEVVAIGPMSSLHELPQDLPGQLLPPVPLITEAGEVADSPLVGTGSVVLRTEPGAELFAFARLAAALAPKISQGDALVDLNHYLPLSHSDAEPMDLRFTPKTEEVIGQLRAYIRRTLAGLYSPQRASLRMAVVVLDTGLDARLHLHRNWRFFDYSRQGRLTPDCIPSDPRGHGTKVARILDEILPPEVEMVVGRLPSSDAELTTLAVAQALGDIVARTVPDVVNLSLATSDQSTVCPSCRERIPVPALFSSLLPMVIRLSGRATSRTVAVMAAGNSGKVANSRWIHSDLDNLVLAVAEDRTGRRAKYSSVVEGPEADLYSASAFGGDDPSEPDAMGVFSDGTHGTSFAAPFVTAAALIAKQLPKFMAPNAVTDLGLRVQAILQERLSLTGMPTQPPL